MIRPCTIADLDAMLAVINDASRVYRDVIPPDRWKSPYMTADELRHEMDEGVRFWGYEDRGVLIAIMGVQDVIDVTLIRHAYVATSRRRSGIGGFLLKELLLKTDMPVLIGTWAAAEWAIRFYEKHGFRTVSMELKDMLLKKYWDIPARQVETSVVLADDAYRTQHTGN